VDVADDGGEAEAEEEAEAEGDQADEQGDGHSAGDAAAATEFEGDDVVDEGKEDDGKEATDVNEQEDFAESPGEEQGEKDSEGEEDVAADGGVAGLLVRGWGGGGQGFLLVMGCFQCAPMEGRWGKSLQTRITESTKVKEMSNPRVDGETVGPFDKLRAGSGAPESGGEADSSASLRNDKRES
jgi:hypothetical protein